MNIYESWIKGKNFLTKIMTPWPFLIRQAVMVMLLQNLLILYDSLKNAVVGGGNTLNDNICKLLKWPGRGKKWVALTKTTGLNHDSLIRVPNCLHSLI